MPRQRTTTNLSHDGTKRAGTGAMLFSLFGLLLTPLVLFYASQVVWLKGLWAPVPWMLTHIKAVGLFWAVYLLPELTLYGLFRRLYPANFVQISVLMGVAVSSRYKMDVIGAPFQLSDFGMAGQLGDLTGYAGSRMIPSGSMLAGIAIAVFLTKIIHKQETWHPPAEPAMAVCGVCLALTVASFGASGPLQRAAAALDEGCGDVVERVDQVGPVLSLYTAWSQRQAVAAESFGADLDEMLTTFREDSSTDRTASLEEVPDIIWITSESFFDITRLPGLTFTDDPLPVFHALAETCTDGRMLSNTYGGGTGNVEMEFFTGLSANFLREGDTMTTLPEGTYAGLPTTVRALKQAGYATTALHSYDATLYRRDVNYPLIGFDTVAFRDDFLTPVELRGTYPSDECFANEVIARYEARDPSKPFFLHGMTMENHQAYTAGKYPTASDYPAQSSLASEADLAIVDALVMGLHDADASLGQLVDYFSQVDRPVLLVFVGDHLPSLNFSDGISMYTHLGITPSESASDWTVEELMEILSTNYLVWSNYETEAAPDRLESCTQLGMRILSRAGVPMSAWFRYLEQDVAPTMLFARGKLFVDGEGNGSYGVPEEAQTVYDTYAALERGLLYGG